MGQEFELDANQAIYFDQVKEHAETIKGIERESNPKLSKIQLKSEPIKRDISKSVCLDIDTKPDAINQDSVFDVIIEICPEHAGFPILILDHAQLGSQFTFISLHNNGGALEVANIKQQMLVLDN
jgi:hypothetical protein